MPLFPDPVQESPVLKVIMEENTAGPESVEETAEDFPYPVFYEVQARSPSPLCGYYLCSAKRIFSLSPVNLKPKAYHFL